MLDFVAFILTFLNQNVAVAATVIAAIVGALGFLGTIVVRAQSVLKEIDDLVVAVKAASEDKVFTSDEIEDILKQLLDIPKSIGRLFFGKTKQAVMDLYIKVKSRRLH